MRILLTTDTVGGVWTFTRELAEGLLSQGIAVALISFGNSPSVTQRAWVSELQDRYKDFLYAKSSAPLEWMTNNSLAYSDALPDLLRLADTFQPDLVHANQFCFGRLPLNLPVIVTAHSDVLSWARACEPSALADSAWLRQYRSLVQGGLAKASAVVAPTRSALLHLQTHFEFEAAYHVVLNGRTLPKVNVHAPRSMQAVSVGRLWDKAKNLQMLKEVHSRVPLVVAGDAGEAVADESLTRLGLLDEASLFQLFRSSSVYVCASLYEPFGLAPLEAALCGCAVLANDISSLREVWGAAAIYFQGAEELRTLLDKLAQQEDELTIWQRRAHRRALELSAERMVSGYRKLYQEVLEPSATLVSSNAEREIHAPVLVGEAHGA